MRTWWFPFVPWTLLSDDVASSNKWEKLQESIHSTSNRLRKNMQIEEDKENFKQETIVENYEGDIIYFIFNEKIIETVSDEDSEDHKNNSFLNNFSTSVTFSFSCFLLM